MKLIGKTEIVIKKSKFIGYYYEIDDVSLIKGLLETIRKENKKARHIAYAYKIGNTAKKSDDKEPANTAGTPIYNIIERKQLNNVLIVAVRYFGGIKLGSGGLIRAYSNTASNLVNEFEQ